MRKYQEIGTILRNRKLEIESDNKYGIHTCEIMRLGNTKGYYDYVPAPYHMLNLLFYHYPFEEKDVFVDVGCGLGRVLVVAVAYGCQKAIGIEINADIYKKLNKNIVACNYGNKILGIYGNAECLVGTQVVGNKYFFFNPFNLRVFQKIIKNILLIDDICFLFLYAPFQDTRDYLRGIEKIQLIKVIGNEDDYELSIFIYKSIDK